MEIEDAFTINEQFASKYESRKKSEELSRLRDKYGSDLGESDSSSDEEEDENGELVTPEIDSQIVKVIEQIRLKDPIVYIKDKNFFEESEIEKTRCDSNGRIRRIPQQNQSILKIITESSFLKVESRAG